MNYQASGKYQFYDFLYTQGKTDIQNPMRQKIMRVRAHSVVSMVFYFKNSSNVQV